MSAFARTPAAHFACALAALALLAQGAPAAAQIAFRAASQAASTAPPAPTFQAAGPAVGSTGAVTPSWPAHQPGDIALLFVESTGGQAVTLSTPAGFAPVAGSPQFTGTGTAGTRLTVFWARATSSLMPNPTVAAPGNHVYAQILTYRGVIDSGNPWDVTGGGIKSVASTTVTVTGVTTSVANTLVVQAVARDTDSAAAAFSNQTNPNLVSLTERVDAGTTQGNGGGFAVWDGTMPQAGATGNTTATVTNSVNAFLTIALRPPDETLTIAKPSGTVAGDVMVASIAVRPETLTVNAPAGWTLVRRLDNANANANSLLVYVKVAGAAEPASYSWGIQPGSTGAVGAILTFSGVDTANPVLVEAGQNTPNGLVHATPSVTTTLANAMLVTSHAFSSAANWTPPIGMTEAADVASVAVPNAVGISLEANYAVQSTAGPSGPKIATASNDADVGNAHILALRPLQALDHFSISHAGGGVACEEHTITITAHDVNHNPVSALGLTVNLSTTNGKGTWTGIVAGGGTLVDPVPGDGAATYTFAPGSMSASLSFRYANLATPSETFGFNVVAGAISETSGSANASDDPPFTMAQAGFQFRNATDNNTTIPTQIAGKPSNLGFNAKTIRLRAIRTDTATGACTTLFANQTRTVELGAECNDPASCAGRQVTVNGTAIATSADNGGAGATAYTGVPLSFGANSEADIVIAYPDAGRISLHARYDLDPGVAGFEMTGSSNAFVVRPFGLAFRGASAAAPIQHGTGPASPVLAAAGDPFAMTIAAYRWAAAEDDGTGNPLPGADITDNGVTPNFAANVNVSATANLPGVSLGTIARGAGCSGAATVPASAWSGGAATLTDWCYTEAGNVFLSANVASYLAPGVQVSGNSGLDGSGSAGGYVGRFRPKHFALDTSAGNQPLLGNRAASLPCASSFSYMGEPMRLSFRLLAQNAQGGTTQNYTGAYAKLDASSTAAFAFGARSGATGLTSRLTSFYPGAAPVWTNGVLDVSILNPVHIAVARATPDNPDGPYSALQLGIAPVDSDGVAMNTLDLDADVNGSNERKSLGVSTEVRFGRLRIANAHGSELVPLALRLETEYWNGTAFVTNTADGCTALLPTHFEMSAFSQNLAACETAISSVGAFSSGRSTLVLAAPGSGNNGGVTLTARLGPAGSGTTCTSVGGAPVPVSGANMLYLRGNWSGAGFGTDPSGRATFGLYRGPEEVIFIQEKF